MSNIHTASANFIRSRFTWLGYVMLGYYAYMQAALGPLMPFVSEELKLNFTVSGLHLSAFAAGMVIAGLFTDRIAARFGRRPVFWGGGLGMVAGAVILMSGQHPAITIAGSFIMGTVGSLTLIMIQATLADKHPAHRANALTEANIVASILSSLAPVMVSLGQSSGLTWRSALVGGSILWFFLVLLFRQEQLPAENEAAIAAAKNRINRPLPSIFWAYWIVVFLGVSIEWCLIFWGSSFLELEIGFTKIEASTLMSAFFIAMIIGRFTGSRLARSIPSPKLLLGAITLVLLGFLVFWLVRSPILNVMGLFVAGLGVANLYPLTLSTVSNLAPDQSNQASARTSLGAGMAILITPQILGSAADTIGLANAYGIVAICALIVAVVLFLSYTVSRKNLLLQEQQ